MRKTIGQALREARLEAKLSARDLERVTGMATAAISQIETGVRKDPGFSTVLRLARAIGVSMEDLAQRVEGKSAGKSGAGSARSAARAIGLIEKARAGSEKSTNLLTGALDALGGRARPHRKR